LTGTLKTREEGIGGTYTRRNTNSSGRDQLNQRQKIRFLKRKGQRKRFFGRNNIHFIRKIPVKRQQLRVGQITHRRR